MINMMGTIEEGVPFSESLLWKLQHNAYKHSGPRAWKISNNPYIARAYAWQTIAAIRDWESELDPNAPLYIVEVGAGAGRFSYLYLKELTRLLPIEQQICLVISDNVEDYLDFWLNHPKLKSFIDDGKLDFANYDPTKGSECTLVKSGTTLNNLSNPLIAITNYFYAALPNDLFRYEDGQLLEGYPVLSGDRITKEELIEDPKKMKEVDVKFAPTEIEHFPRYPDDPGFDEVLQSFKTCLPEGTPFLIPAESFRTIRNLKTLANDRLFIISGDKAFHTPKELKENCDHRPIVTDFGDVNVDVNGYALKLYTEFLEGTMENYPRPPKTDYRDILFNHWIISFNKPHTQARDQFHSLFVDGFNTLDCHKLIDKTLSGDDEFTVDQVLSFFQLSNFDPQLLYFFKRLNIKELFTSLEDSKYHVMSEVMKNVKEHFFWISKEDDALAYLLAQAFYYLYDFEACKEILSHVIQQSGESAQFRYFLALSYKESGDLVSADKEFKRTLELDPKHPFAGKYLT